MPTIGNSNGIVRPTTNSPGAVIGTKVADFLKGKKSSFEAIDPEWDLDELILDDKTKESLNDAISFCSQRDTLVERWNLKRFMKGEGGCTGINMYGEPGTGKSCAADAIAKAIGAKIVKVNYSEIQSEKWGGTEKNLNNLFQEARENKLVVFFDEADSLLSRRQSNGANADTNNEIRSHLLTLLDRNNVVVVFATNFFENYDRAFFRRILFHIKFHSQARASE